MPYNTIPKNYPEISYPELQIWKGSLFDSAKTTIDKRRETAMTNGYYKINDKMYLTKEAILRELKINEAIFKQKLSDSTIDTMTLYNPHNLKQFKAYNLDDFREALLTNQKDTLWDEVLRK